MRRKLSAAAKSVQTFTGPGLRGWGEKKKKKPSIHEVSNLELENKWEQLSCVSGCTDVGYEGLQFL